MSHHEIEIEQEVDGRWLAEAVDLTGVLAYGQSKDEAVTSAEAIAAEMLS